MKFEPPRFRFSLWLAIALAIAPRLQVISFAAVAEAPRETVPETPVAATPPSEAEKPAAPVPPTPPEGTVEPEEPVGDQAAVAESEHDKAMSSEKDQEAEVEAEQPVAKDKKDHDFRPMGIRAHGRPVDNARVGVFQDNKLAADEAADAVVSILGSSTSAGEVRDAVVSILGSSTSSGDVGNAVVSILGSTRVTGGKVGGAAVSVLGSTYVNGEVRGEVVAILGDVELGPDAVVSGEIVCVGGQVIRDPKAIVRGNVQNVGFGGHFLFDGLTAWIAKCLVYGRPLAFGAHLMWAWWIALAYLGFYSFIALLAPGAVEKCGRTLEERPGKSILAAFLTLLLTPVVYVLLALTVFIVIGVALIPLFTLGLFVAGLFGKVVMLAWIGRRLVKLGKTDAKLPAVLTVLIGGVIVLGLYTVPVVGFVVYKLLGVLGLGVVIYTLLLTIKSSRPTQVRSSVSAAGAAVPSNQEESAGGLVIVTPPPIISAVTLPRAGFWIRVSAAFLDIILVCVLFSLLGRALTSYLPVNRCFPLCFAIYNVVMWATKGTTIGGIICGLKVVRLDDKPVGWGVAVVRGLSAFLSLVVAGLGFIWVAFDDEKQSWHDKIAGTTIVRVPKGTSLV